MKNYILLLILCFLFACKASKKEVDRNSKTKHEIITIPMIVKEDTISFNELRFYKIQSAMDGMKLMYLNYGKWDEKTVSKYQYNINRIVWRDRKLFIDDNEKFTVIADGTETLGKYFSSLMVFDSNENDCFADNHPYKERLTELFVSKKKKLDRGSSVYKLFR